MFVLLEMTPPSRHVTPLNLFLLQLSNPKSHKPPFKYGTVPHGSTETNLMKNFPAVYEYMKIYNKSTAIEGVKAVKDG